MYLSFLNQYGVGVNNSIKPLEEVCSTAIISYYFYSEDRFTGQKRN